MQKLPEVPDRKWGEACVIKKKKKYCRKKKKRRDSVTLPFKLRGRSSTRPLRGNTPVCQVLGGFACELCLLLASQHAETSIIKSTRLWTYQPPETANTFLGDATILFGFRNDFLTRRMIVEPKNKAKI